MTFSLAWIQRIASDTGGVSKSSRNVLERAASRAYELGLPHLHALTAFTVVDENMKGVANGNGGGMGVGGGMGEAGGEAGGGGMSGLFANTLHFDSNIASLFLNHGLNSLNMSGSRRANDDSSMNRRRNGGDLDLSSFMTIDDTFANTAVGATNKTGAGGGGPTSHDIHALLSKQMTVGHHDTMEGRALYLRASGWDLLGKKTKEKKNGRWCLLFVALGHCMLALTFCVCYLLSPISYLLSPISCLQNYSLPGHTTLSTVTLRKQIRSYGNGGNTIDVLASVCKLSHLEWNSSTYRVSETVQSGRSSEQLIVNALATLVEGRKR